MFNNNFFVSPFFYFAWWLFFFHGDGSKEKIHFNKCAFWFEYRVSFCNFVLGNIEIRMWYCIQLKITIQIGLHIKFNGLGFGLISMCDTFCKSLDTHTQHKHTPNQNENKIVEPKYYDHSNNRNKSAQDTIIESSKKSDCQTSPRDNYQWINPLNSIRIHWFNHQI